MIPSLSPNVARVAMEACEYVIPPEFEKVSMYELFAPEKMDCSDVESEDGTLFKRIRLESIIQKDKAVYSTFCHRGSFSVQGEEEDLKKSEQMMPEEMEISESVTPEETSVPSVPQLMAPELSDMANEPKKIPEIAKKVVDKDSEDSGSVSSGSASTGSATSEIPSSLPRFPALSWTPGILEKSKNHCLFVNGPFVPDRGPPDPDESEKRIHWDLHHVKMPFAAESKYKLSDGSQIPRWGLVEKNLSSPCNSIADLKRAISSYNGGYEWDFIALEEYVDGLADAERTDFFEVFLPSIIKFALDLPKICTKSVPLLATGKTKSLTLSQKQVACLLANAFLCTIPRRNSSSSDSQFSNYPSINFSTLFNKCVRPKRQQCRKEKFRCIMNYFRRVFEKMPEGNITFTRLHLNAPASWEQSQATLQEVFITSHGLIEDAGQGMLMVDFANRRVGGGVLKDGCVQEEILFLLYPELICSRLFTEALDHDEVLLVTGAERFNRHQGYGDGFLWEGDYRDETLRDTWGRRYCQIVAMDATPFRGKAQMRQQFTQDNIKRELSKALVGFQTPGFPRSCIATGNWGCGAFGGNHQLKFLIQWMAASRAGRPMCYFTFNDEKLMQELRSMSQLLRREKLAIGDLLLLLQRYERLHLSSKKEATVTLSEYFHQNFEADDSDSLSEM